MEYPPNSALQQYLDDLNEGTNRLLLNNRFALMGRTKAMTSTGWGFVPHWKYKTFSHEILYCTEYFYDEILGFLRIKRFSNLPTYMENSYYIAILKELEEAEKNEQWVIADKFNSCLRDPMSGERLEKLTTWK